MEEEKLIDLFVQKKSGTISAEDSLKYEKICGNHGELLAELEKQWETSGSLKLSYKSNVEQSWKEFENLKSPSTGKLVQLWPVLSRVAAVLVLCFGLGLYFLNGEEPTIYTTTAQEVREIELPDGSQITLNGSSTLTVFKDFNEDERTVALHGEAFFDVARDESRPFIIESGEATTQVLGTSFNIRNSGAEGVVLINVVSGKVSFASSQDELILTKDMSAKYDSNNSSLALTSNNSNELFWKTKKLKFNDTKLSEVVVTLEKHFKIKLSLQPTSLANCLFTGSFDDPKLEEVLEVMSISLNLTYENLNNTYILTGEGCPN